MSRRDMLARALFVLSIFAQVAILAHGAPQEPEDESDYVVAPGSIIPGKDYTLLIRPRKKCEGEPLRGVTVDPELGSGFKAVTDEGTDGCYLRVKISAANDAPLGPLPLPLMKDGKLFAMTTLSVQSTSRGPTPPGLGDKVDVSWKVIPRRATSDSFGRRIAKLFFAIEVTIGNNSGYDLQLASVGFILNKTKSGWDPDTPMPTDSYNVTRSVIEREQQVGLRSIVVHGLGGAGAIATGVTPLLKLTSQDNYTSAIALHSPFTQLVERVIPDRTVNHLIAHDNRALRDSVTIPNNLSQKILVFISREIIMCASDETKSENKEKKKQEEEAEKIKKRKSIGIRTKEVSQGCGDWRLGWKKDFDPQQIMERLGELVLVGRQITYLDRVRLVSTAEPMVTPPPVAQPSSEMKISQGTESKRFSITGLNLRGAGVSIEAGAPLKIANVQATADGTLVSFDATTSYDAKPGSFKLFASTPSGQAVMDIEVSVEAPRGSLLPESFSIPAEPSSPGHIAKTLTVSGRFLKDVNDTKYVSIVGGAGKITVKTVTPGGDDSNTVQTLAIELEIAPDTPKKKYQLKITRPGGGEGLFPFEITSEE